MRRAIVAAGPALKEGPPGAGREQPLIGPGNKRGVRPARDKGAEIDGPRCPPPRTDVLGFVPGRCLPAGRGSRPPPAPRPEPPSRARLWAAAATPDAAARRRTGARRGPERSRRPGCGRERGRERRQRRVPGPAREREPGCGRQGTACPGARSWQLKPATVGQWQLRSRARPSGERPGGAGPESRRPARGLSPDPGPVRPPTALHGAHDTAPGAGSLPGRQVPAGPEPVGR